MVHCEARVGLRTRFSHVPKSKISDLVTKMWRSTNEGDRGSQPFSG